MTTQQMIDELQLALGNRQDITPARYTQWLNWAQYDLCGFHTKRVFPSLRFRVLEGKFLMTIPVVTGTAQAGGANNEIILAAATDQADDYFVDCVVKLTAYSGTAPDSLINQTRIIVDYDGATDTATLDEAWDVNPDANTTYEIYRREFDIETFTTFSPRTHLWAIEKLETVRGSSITKVLWQDLLGLDGRTGTSDTIGKFARRGNTLLLDAWISTATSLRAWYYKYPTELDSTVPDGVSELPEPWHEIILLGGIWRGFEKLMEPARADEAFDKYQDEATNRMNQYQLGDEFIQRSIKARSYHVEL